MPYSQFTTIAKAKRVVTNGILWRFLKLEGTVVSIDSLDYPLLPVEQILGVLVWMLRRDS